MAQFPDDIKICPACGLDKPLAQFRVKTKYSVVYLAARCESCRSTDREKYYRPVTRRDLYDRGGMRNFRSDAPTGIGDIIEGPLVEKLEFVFRQKW